MMHTPYMIQLCQNLFNSQFNKTPEEDGILIEICTNWFNHAFNHCSKILTVKPGCTKLWNRIVNLKKLIFQENETSLLSDKIPMPVHPDFLSIANCQELSEKVIKDYIQYIPRYMSVMKENQILWQFFWEILQLVIIVMCLFYVRRWVNKKNRLVICRGKQTQLLELLNCEKDINRILYETKYLSIVPVINPQLLRIGCPVIGLRINRTQFVDIERLFIGSAVRSCENPSDADVSSSQASRFFQATSGKHLLVISIDFDKIKEDEIETKKSPRTSFIPVVQKSEKKMGIRRKQL
ncbi:uncharacterized protein LOC129911834 [Episyrphus balteatus]|uniref:uncharacterized protein LOC129911834 n=1 Tax=Episyrphus balteatus TaxID=286459 RepID=UPI00248683AE|nr:uncharacterized protein LOC129911834 [Episyrphus balteatus]